MLDEYKEAFRQCADLIDGWKDLSKNELCIKYVESEGNKDLQDSYFSAIMYRYWNLIAKYHYMSSNVASPEDCYEWLEDSVYCCLTSKSWEKKDSSIYKDPNGPDKVINRCMKCARLTYYQFINRKKRKDNFGLLSLDELAELFGTTVSEPASKENLEGDIEKWAIEDYIRYLFLKKDYFAAVILDAIQTQEVFDVKISKELGNQVVFSLRKLTRFMSTIEDSYVHQFADKYNFTYEDAEYGMAYFRKLKQPTIKAKIQTVLERLQNDAFIRLLKEGR